MVRIPELGGTLDISVSILGIALLIGALGSLSALLVAGRVIQAVGARWAAIAGFCFLVAGSFIAGIGWGLSDVAINMEGTNLEKQTNKTKLPFLHGMYSLGTLLGAGAGVALIASHTPLAAQSAVFAVVILITVALSAKTLPNHTGLRSLVQDKDGTTVKQPPYRPSRRVLMLGAGILVMSLAEGGAQDWLTLALVQDIHFHAFYSWDAGHSVLW